MPLTIHGKKLKVASMWSKGRGFVQAAILLRAEGGNEYVVLHLFCQGFEILAKAALLLKDYDEYVKKLPKKYGHNLAKVVRKALKEHGLKPLNKETEKELAHLEALYAGHWLRYASLRDLLVDPRTIASDRVVRKLLCALRLAERKSMIFSGRYVR